MSKSTLERILLAVKNTFHVPHPVSDLSGSDQPHLGHSLHPRVSIYHLRLGHPGLLCMGVESMPWDTYLQPHLLVDPSDLRLSPDPCSPISLPCHGCCRPQLCHLLISMGVGMASVKKSLSQPLLGQPLAQCCLSLIFHARIAENNTRDCQF